MTADPSVAQLFDLTDRVALVTGATGFLGQAIARALAEAGAIVVATSRHQGRAAKVAADLPAPPHGNHAGIALNQLDSRSRAEGFQAARDHAGHIDILVNNGHQSFTSTEWDSDAFSRELANATAYYELARMAHEDAVKRNAGAPIIMIGSMYGVVGSYPDAYAGVCEPSQPAYHALKGAIVHLTRRLSVYWAADGVRVNCLSPGPFPNPSTAPPGLVERLTTKSPMGRMGKPWELKGAVVFLASNASTYVTGHNLLVDGGWTAW